MLSKALLHFLQEIYNSESVLNRNWLSNFSKVVAALSSLNVRICGAWSHFFSKYLTERSIPSLEVKTKVGNMQKIGNRS